jgi:hypothetical protein
MPQGPSTRLYRGLRAANQVLRFPEAIAILQRVRLRLVTAREVHCRHSWRLREADDYTLDLVFNGMGRVNPFSTH